MANPVSAVRGPSTQNPRTFVFYINSKKRLGLDQYIDSRSGGDPAFVKWSPNGSTVFAEMLTPNNIQAVYQYGIIKLFGFVQPNKDKAEYYVSELSPTTRYLTGEDDGDFLKTNVTKLAVVGDKGDYTWFYYFRRDTEESPLYIQAGKQNALAQWDFQKVSDAEPASTSSIAAIYLPETKTRVVFWQKKEKNRISVATITDENSAVSIIESTTNALSGTSIAVTFTGDDKNRVLHLYYVDASQKLNSTTATWSSTSWVWQTSPRLLKTTATISKTGQLSVVQCGTLNQVMYIQEGSPSYGLIQDPIITQI